MKTKIQIKSITGKVLFAHKCNSIADCLKAAVTQGANLQDANLRGANLLVANLRGANLQYADLWSADLQGANFRDADLQGANLRGADLQGADLQGADLQYTDLLDANLRGANLLVANLRGANLQYADLWSADLQGANLRGADLQGADLRGADLWGADLQGADLLDANLLDANLWGANLQGADLEILIKQKQIIPEDGSFIAWKKLQNGYIAKLEIPPKARRLSTPVGRKCRASEAKVLAIYNNEGKEVKEVCTSKYNAAFTYETGRTVKPDKFDDNPLVECSNGIHFFVTRYEAEQY